jgi:outer membrane receptor for ferrienterochelin and colicins
MKHLITLIILFCFSFASLLAQTGTITGKVISKRTGQTVPFANVQFTDSSTGSVGDAYGRFSLKNVPAGKHTLRISFVGYLSYSLEVDVISEEVQKLEISLDEENLNLNEVVVTGTRTAKRITDSPVIVNLINSKELDQVVAINLSDGLKFQPGLRVETDCQTCNYSQIRMNGLQGGYSQILINSRSIFSPLTGLYGLEQIPVNMIERIEVVRGGVSALYGSSAIGGTVNVITRVPEENSFNITNTTQSINGEAIDNILSANATVINENENAGATFFVNNRNRQAFDANGDNFSEAPQLKDNTFGTNLFFVPTDNQKISVSLSSIYEYRYGGEMVPGPAYLAQQSEERTHNVFMGSFDYQVFFNDKKNSLAVYYGGQKTHRVHYTGIVPDKEDETASFVAAPPYGTSDVITHQGGVQLNNSIENFLGGQAVLTVGAEYAYDDVFDQIKSYNYLIDQTTTDFGVFVQHDWDVLPNLNLLAGARFDKHNLVEIPVISPRFSVLYKLKGNSQFRAGWGTGFRAPQAFDTDLHIAFAAGGVSRISLADNLKEERSNSYTASYNYDKASEHFIAGFTLEGFYTTLDDSFYQFPLGEDSFGQLFEKRNGPGATVKGITIEARANFDYVLQLDAGYTIQSSLYNKPVETIENLPTKSEFLRTPNMYGYGTITYTPTKSWSASANVVYTGTMEIAHFGGVGTGQSEDEYFSTPTFAQIGVRLGHTLSLEKTNTGLELFGGVKNMLNAFQDDFDISKNRDSNYIYGPSLPRTFFVGIRIKSL